MNGEKVNKVYFASMRPLYRAENIKAVYNAYDGEKEFIQLDNYRDINVHDSIVVTDEFLSYCGVNNSVIMITHGIPGTKYYGYDMKYPYIGEQEGGLLTWVVCSSSDMIDIVAKQCRVNPARVLPLGMPRTDQYYTVKQGGTILQKKKKAYLYLPTFRSDTDSPYPPIDYDIIDSLLEKGEVLAVKPHMLDYRMDIGRYKHIIDLSSYDETAPYLIDADVIVTDYSSVIFDAHILQKPVVLFAKDADAYKATRGMYFDYPGGYASNYATVETKLVQLMKSARRSSADEDCRRRCCGSCDGKSTQRVIMLIKKELEWRL